MKKTRKKNRLTRKRRKDHFTKKRRKNKSKYNKRSIKRYRKTIKRNKRKYRGGGSLVIKVNFEGYSFYTNVTVMPALGFNLKVPKGEVGGPYLRTVQSQVCDLLFRVSSSARTPPPPYDFTLEKAQDYSDNPRPIIVKPTDPPPTYFSGSIGSNNEYVSEYTLSIKEDFLVNLCYCCSLGPLKEWRGDNARQLRNRREVLKNILGRMNLTKEQFRYASEILYYLMNISDTIMRTELINSFKDILGFETFKVIAENRICRVWTRGGSNARDVESYISPKCIVDKGLVDVDENIVEIFKGMECKGYRVTVDSEETNDSETGKKFTQYTITLYPSNSTDSTDSFSFRWSDWVGKSDDVAAKLEESRRGLQLVGYTDKDYFSKKRIMTFRNKTALLSHRKQMLTAIFNRQDLGVLGLFDQKILGDNIRSLHPSADPIGMFEEIVTTQDEESIRTLFYNIKEIFKTASSGY